MRKLVSVFSGLLLFVAAWYFFTDGTMHLDTAKKKLVQQAQDAVISNVNPDEVAALAMKAINLTQGEHGVELWRLKADWGNMRRKDNILELEKPRFTYYMPPDNKAITIASGKGDIEQTDQKIRFLDSVVATYDGRTLLAPQMIYFGKSREIHCPEGGSMEGEGYEGAADRVVLNMNAEIIEAFGNVDITFDAENDVLTPRRQPKDIGIPQGQEGLDTAPAQG